MLLRFTLGAIATGLLLIDVRSLRAMPAVEIGSRLELWVDRLLIDELNGTTLRLHEPISAGIALRVDRPWEGPANAPRSVFKHQERYLMYYRAMTADPGDKSGRTCVAVSRDGLTWEKPKLGLVPYRGRTDTNIIADTAGRELAVVPWLDTRPGVPADERIKAFHSEAVSGESHTPFFDPKGAKRLVMFSSADGFRFRRLDQQPRIVSDLKNAFDGGNTLFWSEAEQQYVLYFRIWDEGRSMARMVSRDFIHWSEPTPMQYGGTPREQFYNNQTQPYARAPHLYIAPAARFMERRRAITAEQARAIGLHELQGHRYDQDVSDVVLLTSRAGSSHYDRTFMEAWVRPGMGASNWVSRTNYPVTGFVPDGADRMMLFIARHYMQDTWHLERLQFRTDGFSSIHAPWAGGSMRTKPLTFSGDRLVLNYRTSAAGGVRVELQDQNGAPIPGYAATDCVEIIGDEIERVVQWKQGTSVRAWAGRPVRLRFIMKDADLFSLQFK